ncbi:hypothetical protein AB0I55_29355 [Actinocatenispora sera]|uniref:hypothetical protein n=1 Tax=Actinocatenispora sera TaxID=390989 RepID=UPI0033D90C29
MSALREVCQLLLVLDVVLAVLLCGWVLATAGPSPAAPAAAGAPGTPTVRLPRRRTRRPRHQPKHQRGSR